MNEQRRMHDEPEYTGPRWGMGRVIFAVLLVYGIAGLWWERAHAGTTNLTCTPPTQNTDGSPITGTLSYKFYWGTTATTLTNIVTAPTCAAAVTVPTPPAGQTVTYYFAATAVANGNESVKTPAVTKAFTTPYPIPQPPASLTALAGTAAFSIKPDYTTFGPMQASSQVGTVRATTTCVARQRIAGTDLYRIPKTAVTFSRSATDYVVANCRAQS